MGCFLLAEFGEAMKGIDVSIYSGEIPVEKWRAVKAEGYDLAVVGLFHGRTVNRYAAQQMRAAHEAGMLLAGYVLIAPWTGKSGAEQVAAGISVAAVNLIEALQFVAIDAEIDGITSNMIENAVEAVWRRGLRPIIYTGRWWWVDHFGDSQAFKGIPLWAAQYPLVHPDPPEAYLGNVALFGGWTRDKLVGWQYAGTTDLCGVSCDLNWFDDAFVRGEEEPMPEITDDFAGLREHEMEEMWGTEEAHQVTRLRQMQTLSAIRHSKHESPEEEMKCWKAYSLACDAEVAAIREAQERCRVHGRPG